MRQEVLNYYGNDLKLGSYTSDGVTLVCLSSISGGLASHHWFTPEQVLAFASQLKEQAVQGLYELGKDT